MAARGCTCTGDSSGIVRTNGLARTVSYWCHPIARAVDAFRATPTDSAWGVPLSVGRCVRDILKHRTSIGTNILIDWTIFKYVCISRISSCCTHTVAVSLEKYALLQVQGLVKTNTSKIIKWLILIMVAKNCMLHYMAFIVCFSVMKHLASTYIINLILYLQSFSSYWHTCSYFPARAQHFDWTTPWRTWRTFAMN